jgi:hypothetical protein
VDSNNVTGDSVLPSSPGVVFEVLSPQTKRMDRDDLHNGATKAAEIKRTGSYRLKSDL